MTRLPDSDPWDRRTLTFAPPSGLSSQGAEFNDRAQGLEPKWSTYRRLLMELRELLPSEKDSKVLSEGATKSQVNGKAN
jgi:hypothetical protein